MRRFSPTLILQQLKPVPAESGRLVGLDGLRGVAMLMVIFCHLGLMGIGWTGLSSFFVLSGFLITRILLTDIEVSSGLGEYYKRFYVRRLLRVFPIYYAYLFALLLGVLFVSRLERLGDDLPFAFAYVYNIYMAVSHEQEHTRMLTHLWSLSVEEQFYLFWPVVIAMMNRTAVYRFSLALVLLGPAIRYVTASYVYPQWVEGTHLTVQQVLYVMTPTHLDAFALGALINFVPVQRCARMLPWVFAMLVGLGIWSSGFAVLPDRPGAMYLALGWPLWMHENGQWIWGYSLVNLFWFCVICAILSPGRVRQFFSIRVFDALGKRSYSTYIVHYPILGFSYHYWKGFKAEFGDVLGTLLFAVPYLAVVFVVSALTFRFVEKPMLKLKDRYAAYA